MCNQKHKISVNYINTELLEKAKKRTIKYLNAANIYCDKMIELLAKDKEEKFIKAAYEGKYHKVESYIKQGVNVNAKDKEGKTALIEAEEYAPSIFSSTRKSNIDIVKLLVEHGADVNAKDEMGVTTLMWAAYKGWLDDVKLLVEHGADVNAKDKEGRTARNWAEIRVNTKIAEFLIEHSGG